MTSIERTADGEALSKQIRRNNGNGLQPIQPQTIRFEPVIRRRKKKTKPKRRTAKQSLSEYCTKYDVLSELAKANSNLTFGEMIRGDGDKAKTDCRGLLSRGATVPSSITAATATPKTRPVASRSFQLKHVDLTQKPR